MKLIPLTKGFYAKVDDGDYTELARYKWFTRCSGRKTELPYAIRHVPGTANGQVPMHDHLMEPPPTFTVDHRNGDTLDYRRENLRVCTEQQNQLNKSSRGGSSRYKGVYWRADTERWAAEIRANKVRTALGCFDSEACAARAYDAAAIEFHGEFARLNFPRDPAQTSAILEGPGYVRREA